MLALIVELHVRPEMREEFLQAVTENSAASIRDELGCLRFDHVVDAEDPLHFFFYELYADEEAWAAHRRAPHFARWRAAANRCVTEGGQRNVVGPVLLSRVHTEVKR